MGTRLAVRTMCERAAVSRAGFYRFELWSKKKPARRDPALRDEIQKIALAWPS